MKPDHKAARLLAMDHHYITTKEVDNLRAAFLELERLARDAATRMERARNILSENGNWAMLDTQALRNFLGEE